jgi:hypothetical protein
MSTKKEAGATERAKKMMNRVGLEPTLFRTTVLALLLVNLNVAP